MILREIGKILKVIIPLAALLLLLLVGVSRAYEVCTWVDYFGWAYMVCYEVPDE